MFRPNCDTANNYIVGICFRTYFFMSYFLFFFLISLTMFDYKTFLSQFENNYSLNQGTVSLPSVNIMYYEYPPIIRHLTTNLTLIWPLSWQSKGRDAVVMAIQLTIEIEYFFVFTQIYGTLICHLSIAK